MVTSLPEKTLEHWASQYVLYRFRSLAEVWWPPFGEDVSVASMPRRPGKAVCLEIKTASVEAGRHLVDIDLKQLGAYLRQPLRNQPFYVFPLPRWTGVLDSAVPVSIGRAWLRPSELAFSRAGSGGWFANWTYVLTAREVEAALGTAVADYQAGNRSRDGRLVSIDPATGDLRWPNAAGTPVLRSWASFWDRLTECGEADWPQTLLVDASSIAAGTIRVDRDAASAALLAPNTSVDASVLVLTPDGDEGYRVLTLEAALGEDTPTAYADHADAHRVTVFIGVPRAAT